MNYEQAIDWLTEQRDDESNADQVHMIVQLIEIVKSIADEQALIISVLKKSGLA